MGVEVSHGDVVIMELRKKVKVWCEIGETAGYRGDVNVMNVDRDIVDDGCNGEVLSDGVIGEEGVGRDADEGDRVMNGGEKSSNVRVTKAVLTVDRIWVDLSLDNCIHAIRMFFRAEKGI